MDRIKLIQDYCKDETIVDDVGDNKDTPIPLFYVSPQAEDTSTEEKYVYQGLIESDVEDPIRKSTRYHWFYSGEQTETTTQTLFLNKPNSYNILKAEQYEIVPDSEEIVKQVISFDIKKVENKLANVGVDIDQEQLDEKINEINEMLSENNDFYYLVLSHNRPIVREVDSSERQEFSISTKNEYRFYNESYESSNNLVSTTVLPNYYIINEDNFYRSQNGGEEYINKDVANYDGTVTPSRHKLIKEFSSTPFNEDTANKIGEKLTNVLYPWDKMGLYYDYNNSSFEDIYPYNLKLEFDTERVGYISQILKETDLNDLLLSNIFLKEDADEIETKLFSIQGNSQILRKREEIDVLEIDNNILEVLDKSFIESDSLCLLDNIKQQGDTGQFYIDHEAFKMENFRTFEDMIDGKSCYSETLYYKVDKYEIDGENFQKIQSFYISNTNEIDKVSILDTQVKYGKKYRYEVFSYKYAVANRYKYVKQGRTGSSYNIFISPTPVIVKMLFSTIEEVVLDKPPAPPEVEVIPYKDNSEQISFFFNPSALQYKIKEHAFTEEERRQYSLIRDSQNLAQDELITFGGDDKTDRYYVYRTDIYPSSYQDFKDSIHSVVYTEENCVSAEFLDDLVPNKKYYYIFRSVDVHGHVSPPTEVREIELINEDGTVFLISKVVPFKENKFQKEEKNIKKYIHIKPSLLQRIIDESTLELQENETTASDIVNNVKLGNEELLEEAVWNKPFKMRIKSKSTNKFVDIKFRFKAENKQNNG